ncbi:MAG TPA: Sec-independent protein translocase subunit TatA, partial [Gaiellales bacterium]|nr:Sec-independent protein translocase subunit TatA [Gaiellales bacterium]
SPSVEASGAAPRRSIAPAVPPLEDPMNLGAPEIVLIILAVLLLFGYKKLPDASRSLGRSLRIFKGEMKGMKDDDVRAKDAATTMPAVTPQATPPTATAPTATSGTADLTAQLSAEAAEAEARAAEARAAELRARAEQARVTDGRG